MRRAAEDVRPRVEENRRRRRVRVHVDLVPRRSGVEGKLARRLEGPRVRLAARLEAREDTAVAVGRVGDDQLQQPLRRRAEPGARQLAQSARNRAPHRAPVRHVTESAAVSEGPPLM